MVSLNLFAKNTVYQTQKHKQRLKTHNINIKEIKKKTKDINNAKHFGKKLNNTLCKVNSFNEILNKKIHLLYTICIYWSPCRYVNHEKY